MDNIYLLDNILALCRIAGNVSGFSQKFTRDGGFFVCLFFFPPQQVRLKALTDIVWPEIALLVQKRINQARDEGIV